jgi:hypothetical protein
MKNETPSSPLVKKGLNNKLLDTPSTITASESFSPSPQKLKFKNGANNRRDFSYQEVMSPFRNPISPLRGFYGAQESFNELSNNEGYDYNQANRQYPNRFQYTSIHPYSTQSSMSAQYTMNGSPQSLATYHTIPAVNSQTLYLDILDYVNTAFPQWVSLIFFDKRKVTYLYFFLYNEIALPITLS